MYGRPVAALRRSELKEAVAASSWPAAGITIPVYYFGKGKRKGLALCHPPCPLAHTAHTRHAAVSSTYANADSRTRQQTAKLNKDFRGAADLDNPGANTNMQFKHGGHFVKTFLDTNDCGQAAAFCSDIAINILTSINIFVCDTE